jgi:hypothetical protein
MNYEGEKAFDQNDFSILTFLTPCSLFDIQIP